MTAQDTLASIKARLAETTSDPKWLNEELDKLEAQMRVEANEPIETGISIDLADLAAMRVFPELVPQFDGVDFDAWLSATKEAATHAQIAGSWLAAASRARKASDSPTP